MQTLLGQPAMSVSRYTGNAGEFQWAALRRPFGDEADAFPLWQRNYESPGHGLTAVFQCQPELSCWVFDE